VRVSVVLVGSITVAIDRRAYAANLSRSSVVRRVSSAWRSHAQGALQVCVSQVCTWVGIPLRRMRAFRIDFPPNKRNCNCVAVGFDAFVLSGAAFSVPPI